MFAIERANDLAPQPPEHATEYETAARIVFGYDDLHFLVGLQRFFPRGIRFGRIVHRHRWTNPSSLTGREDRGSILATFRSHVAGATISTITRCRPHAVSDFVGHCADGPDREGAVCFLDA
ncbi:hypothetical protein [Jannaschia aquimarina]|uniref:hypothetical protein n=1 Tax=Jannaschia aquimarina TaxID=935700 RepID=UPI001F423F88|nr:hypothetical protein [Jannaschia aquimarina]